MSGLLISACCGCAPCIFTDTFDGEALDERWETSDLSGGTAAAFTLDTGADTLTATGDGSLTMRATAPTGSNTIYVEASVLNPGSSTSTGVTIGEADSADRISLVRVWGTANGYELRQGTTVLEAFTDAGGNPIKLEIVTPAGPTTDVKCYIGGVLAHTETGVAWTLPTILDLGVIAEDGGEWEHVTFSPCPTPCDPCPIECLIDGVTTVNLPEYYWFDITVDEGPNCCGGDWASGCYLLRNAESLYGAGTDPDSGDPNCSYYLAVDPDDVNSVLYAPTGYYDEAADDGVCGTGFSSTPLIRLTVTTDNLLVTFTVAEIDAPDSTPTSWTNYNDYEYSASPSTIADYCSGPFTLAKGSGFMSCWPTDDFPTPPNNTAWPATASLQAADCETPRECPFEYEPDEAQTECCANPIRLALPVRRAGLFPGSGTLLYSATGGPSDGAHWSGTITESNCETTVSLACQPCASGDCSGSDTHAWYLSINGSAYRLITDGVACDPFSSVIPLDPWDYQVGGSPGSAFILACTTLIIGDDPGTIDDVASLDMTMTITPDVGSPIVVNRTLTPTACNEFADSFDFNAGTECDPIPAAVTFTLSEGATDLSAEVGSSSVTDSDVTSCDPYSASFGPVEVNICGEIMDMTITLAETP